MRLFRFPTLTYETARRWQTETAAAVRAGDDEALALLQLRPVYAFGRHVRREHLLVDPETLRARGACVVETDRGGDVTFHGPGQLVAYPVLDLRRHRLGVRDYVRALEETMIRALEGFGVEAGRVPGRPGVWSGDAKLGAVGVRVAGGVTTHGFALNVETDLSWFEAIVPCGLRDAGVTSVERLLGRSPGVEAVEAAVVGAFGDVFGVSLRAVDDARPVGAVAPDGGARGDVGRAPGGDDA